MRGGWGGLSRRVGRTYHYLSYSCSLCAAEVGVDDMRLAAARALTSRERHTHTSTQPARGILVRHWPRRQRDVTGRRHKHWWLPAAFAAPAAETESTLCLVDMGPAIQLDTLRSEPVDIPTDVVLRPETADLRRDHNTIDRRSSGGSA